MVADGGSAGEENEEEQQIRERETTERKNKPMFTITLCEQIFYIIAAQRQECIICLLHVITIKLIFCNILLKCPHVSFNASIPYLF